MYLFKITSMICILYFSLNNTIERVKQPTQVKDIYNNSYNKKKNILSVENKERKSLRKKIIDDVEYHKLTKLFTEEAVAHISLNREGKVLGYKPCNVFYARYFTNTQLKKLFKTNKKFKQEHTTFCIVKLTMYNAKSEPWKN